MAVMETWFTEIDLQRPAIRMDRGQLDLRPPPSLLVDAVQELGREVFSYPAYSPRMVDALAGDLLRSRGLPPAPRRMIVTHGASGAIAASMRALCRPGDRVLVPAPVWPAVLDLVRLAGAVPDPYPCLTGQDLDGLAEWIDGGGGAGARVLFLNFPHNPTGLCLTMAQARAVLAAARRNGLVVVSDEAYEGLAPEGRLPCVVSAELPESDDVVLILSMSKRFGAPGLRLGVVRAAEPLAKKIGQVSQFQTGGVSPLSRQVATRLLEAPPDFEEGIRREVARRREVAAGALHEFGVDVPSPRGGIYVLCDVPGGVSGWAVARRLLAQGVGVVPGEVFGCPGTVRMTLGVPVEELRTGLMRVGEELARCAGGADG